MRLGQAIDRVRKNIARLSLQGAEECYSVSEAVYLLVGGPGSGLKAMRIASAGHWFLQGPWGEVIDLTAGQFDGELPDYADAKGAAFYPKCSNLAKELMK